jgi:ABC-type Fe3+-hydroxamate transport system substrate-binding protein
MERRVDQMGRIVHVPEHPQRIVSLVPSQTELLHDLGLGDRVVGITKFCVHPEEWFRSRPRIGGTKKVDLDKVRALRPDLILANKEENTQADIEVLAQEFPVWISDVHDLEGALDMIRRVGRLTGTGKQGEAIADLIATRFAALRPDDSDRSVAYLIWRDPWMAAGSDTFIHDMLLRCGWHNALADGPGRYPELTDAGLAAADPDIILLSSEPYPFQEKHIAELNMICPGTPVRLVDGELFSWYGPRLLRSPGYFSGLMTV